jgi:O-methyltransferase
MTLGKTINLLLRFLKVEVRRIKPNSHGSTVQMIKPCEIPTAIWDLIIKIHSSQLSMVSLERLIATANSTIYVCKNNLLGAFVECGVWRGGNAILAAKIFEFYGKENKVYLYDTFEGMVPPSKEDHSTVIGSAGEIYNSKLAKGENWCLASEDDVLQNFLSFEIALTNVVIVKGDVLNTLKVEKNIPGEIAILRLDTDWYESTKFELQILYPLVVSRGIVMFDDYGFWGGHQKAIDEYFLEISSSPHLSYVDMSCRLIVK